jgi:Lrp/AsnC family transcriptional regulator, regulator for asnA, asnC and gidA
LGRICERTNRIFLLLTKIDAIDLKILAELQKDANISVPKLSKKINVNPSVVYSRIKRLTKRQLIRRFTIEVNDDVLGYNVSAIIGLNIDSKVREQILEEMLRMEGIRDVYEVTGRFDLLVRVKAKSLEDLHSTVSAKMGKLNGVNHTETFIEMRRREPESAYPSQIS